MKNEEIRAAARSRNVKLWEIADHIGISQSTLTVWLRHELPEKKKQAMLEAVEAIAAAR